LCQLAGAQVSKDWPLSKALKKIGSAVFIIFFHITKYLHMAFRYLNMKNSFLRGYQTFDYDIGIKFSKSYKVGSGNVIKEDVFC